MVGEVVLQSSMIYKIKCSNRSSRIKVAWEISAQVQVITNPIEKPLGAMTRPKSRLKIYWLWGRWVISCAQLLYRTLAEATVVYMGTLEWNCFLKRRGCTFLLPWDKNYIIYISNMTGKCGVSNIVGLWHFTFHKKFFNNKWKWNRKILIPLICIHTLHTF